MHGCLVQYEVSINDVVLCSPTRICIFRAAMEETSYFGHPTNTTELSNAFVISYLLHVTLVECPFIISLWQIFSYESEEPSCQC